MKLRSAPCLLALALIAAHARADSVIVFNEIMYHPADGALPATGEWLELQNQMAVDLDISGWSLAGGVEFTLPAGTILPAGGLLVIAEQPAALTTTGLSGVLGPWSGKLDNKGEAVRLINNNGRMMDEVDFKAAGDWPVAADGGGPSLVKKARFMNSGAAASWRTSARSGGTPGRENFTAFLPPASSVVLEAGAAWKFQNSGTDQGTAWRAESFDDSAWAAGNAAFQLGTDVLPTPAVARTPLVSGPVTSYFRRPFSYTGSAAYSVLRLKTLLDDGAVFYLNGQRLTSISMPTGEPLFTTPASVPRLGAPVFQEVTVPGTLLKNGTNVLAAEVHQAGPLASFANAVLASGPTGYWRLDEAAGNALNLAGTGGTLSGTYSGIEDADRAQAGPRPVDAVGGNALLGFETGNAAPIFRGNAAGGNDAVIIPDDGSFNYTTGRAFTLEAWVKGNATQESGACLITKGPGGGEQFSFDVSGGNYRVYVRNSSLTPTIVSTVSKPNNTWQHVVAVFDQAAAIMRIYVNGVSVGSATPPTTLRTMTDPVSIGSRRSSASSGYDLNFDGRIDETAIYNRALTPAEILAHYNSAFTAAPGGIDTTDAVFDLEMTAVETLPAAVPPPVVFNEISGSRLELMNTGTAAVTLTGCLLRTAGDFGITDITLPELTVQPGALASLNHTSLPGQRILLFAPDGLTLWDAALVDVRLKGRYPDGTGPWLYPSIETPGSPNLVPLHQEVVINEIMYDPPAAALTPLPAKQTGQWLELYNKSGSAVGLQGWALAGGIRFTFPAGASLPAGGYVIIAENPAAFNAAHTLAGTTVLGPWQGKLSKSADKLRLLDAAGNPADEVEFTSEGRWPANANAGGSSLELRDAAADNNIPESWAASDESAKSGWQTFTWRGPNNASQTGEPTLWHELNLLLVDGPGECLVDDVRLTDTVTSENLIQNGGFNDGAAHWRFLGTHRLSKVEAEPGAPGNNVLHVIATGPGEYQGNQIESTFLNNRTLTTGREYEISLRARWLSGGGRLNTRLYFNRLPRTNLLNVVSTGGTPGAVNSRALANTAPTFKNLRHTPPIPAAGQPVVVSVEAEDPQGVSSMQVKYSVQGGAWQTVPMTAAGGSRFTASIPGQNSGTVQFYVEGQDAPGLTGFFPAAGPASRALYPIQDSQAAGALPKVRIVMKPADATFLHTAVNTLSNEYLGCTVIADESEVYYDAGVRLKGSFVGRNVARVGFTLRFNNDHLFRGIHDKVAIDRSQHTTLGQGELILKYMAGRAGGIPNMYDDLTQFIHPISSYSATAQLRLTAFENEYLDTQYPDGADGTMFEMEVHRWNLQTVDGNPESVKLPGNEGSGTGYNNVELADFGTNQEAYRWTMLQSKDRDQDDYSAAVGMSRMFAKTGLAFDAEANVRLDNDAWLRTLAFQSLTGVADAAFTGGAVHNFRVYFQPNNGRALYLPWDWDSAWQLSTSASLIGGGNIAKVVTATADRRRRYYWQLNDLVAGVFNATYMQRWTQHYGAVSGEDYSGILSYITNRAAYVRTQMPVSAFAANAGAIDANGVLKLTGTGGIGILYIEVNGIPRTPVWTSNTAWTLNLPLSPGVNTLTIRGIDKNGAPIAGASSTLTVTNPSTTGWPALKINELMADNKSSLTDPADGKFEDWLELHNPLPLAVDMSGWRLTDDPATAATAFVIPSGWSIPANGKLLVWADGESQQNVATPAAGSGLHVTFKLSAGGETLVLQSPDGVEADRVVFGPQAEDRSEGRYPDGAPAWKSLTAASPAGPNVMTEFLRLSLNQPAPEIELSTTPGWSYQLQGSPDLQSWQDASPLTPASAATLTLPAPPAGTARYYRAVVSDN
ncbi:MAG: CotH protein [Verrucomicrobiales bacterium]|nr:CotH protein [Verrucomicrobiales bacterium]